MDALCLYIHIPFCQSKCNYCNFCSFSADDDLKKRYLKALNTELTDLITTHRIKSLKTIYIGGGTPNSVNLNDLITAINPVLELEKTTDYEFTTEINPGLSNKDYFKGLYEIGVNRISVGVQSLADEDLLLMGRIHSSQDIFRTIQDISDSEISNISIDLIYGLPNQTITRWKNNLTAAIKLNPAHISIYGLKIEPETPFYKIYKPDDPALPDETTLREMFFDTHNLLNSAGYDHYEISNHAKKGFKSFHNLNYWMNNDYFAAGLAAHGYINGIRYNNTGDINSYILDYKAHQAINVIPESEKTEDAIFLNLRLLKGIDIKAFNQRYGINFTEKYKNILTKYSEYFITDNGFIRLNLNGILLSNYILAEFLET